MTTHKLLGVYIEENVTWENQVNYICQTVVFLYILIINDKKLF